MFNNKKEAPGPVLQITQDQRVDQRNRTYQIKVANNLSLQLNDRLDKVNEKYDQDIRLTCIHYVGSSYAPAEMREQTNTLASVSIETAIELRDALSLLISTAQANYAKAKGYI